jgi:hypothetical protein
MGFSIEEVKKGMGENGSKINKIYTKLLEEKKVNFTPIHPNFVPSILSSFNSPTGVQPIKFTQQKESNK